jgi:uncharacterized protein YecT (DUF1311 family)
MSHPFRRAIVLLALTGLVAACSTTPEQQAQRDDERCAERGYQPNSKGHDDCITSLRAQRDARMQRRHQELVERPATPFPR